MRSCLSTCSSQAIRGDLSLALCSFVFVYAFICFHSRSLMLGTLGALQIVASFPLALAIYRFVLGVRLFGVMHIIGIYVILGIGCDDLFVLLDAWNQALWMAPPEARASTESRLWWAYRRAIRAMLVTTVTDVSAFMSTVICIVPNLVSFAIFTSLLAVANFLLVCTMWPCALVAVDKMCSRRRTSKSALLSCCCSGMTPGHHATGRSSELDGEGGAEACGGESQRSRLATSDGAATRGCEVGRERSIIRAYRSPEERMLSSSSSSSLASTEKLHSAQHPGSAPYVHPPTPRASPPPSPPEKFGGEGERDGASGAKGLRATRFVERIYAKHYVPFLSRGRNALWMLLGSSAIGLLFGRQALRLQPASHDVNVWPAWHNAFRYLETRDGRFELKRERVTLLWGVRGVDRRGVDPWDETELGQLEWDPAFDAAEPRAQEALLRGCVEPVRNPALRVVNGSASCVIGAFYEWNARRTGNASWPLSRYDFTTRFGAFLLMHEQWAAQISVVKTRAPNATSATYRLRHVTASFEVRVERHAPARLRQPLYEAWQAEVSRQRAVSPPSCRSLLQSARGMWVLMAVQELLLFYAVTVVLALAIVGFVVISVATRSIRLAAACMLTILNVVGTFTGFMVWAFNMEPGMIESVVLMVSVGLMLDPLTHVAHAFNEAPGTRAQRLADGLTAIGISVLAGALSTAGSCVFLFFCTINFFLQFGQLLCTLLVVTIVYTNTFLAPLLLLIGPSDETSALDAACLRCVRRLCSPASVLLRRVHQPRATWRQFDAGHRDARNGSVSTGRGSDVYDGGRCSAPELEMKAFPDSSLQVTTAARTA